jgi:hypothetical protein
MPGPVFLRGETVELHTVETADLGYLQRLVNDPWVRETLGSVLPYTEPGQREWYDSLGRGDLPFLVCIEDEPVGYVELGVASRAGTAGVPRGGSTPRARLRRG